MTNNTHTIAAILASQTPIGTQYRLVDVPGTELTDGRCPFCGQPLHAKMCEAQRAQMQPARTPRYRIAVVLNGNYYALLDGDQELSDADACARLNEQAQEIDRLRAYAAHLEAEAAALNTLHDHAVDDRDALRSDLDDAHQHVGALTAAIDELDDLGEWIWSEADDATLLSIYLRESHHTELMDLVSAARAWLRRRG